MGSRPASAQNTNIKLAGVVVGLCFSVGFLGAFFMTDQNGNNFPEQHTTSMASLDATSSTQNIRGAAPQVQNMLWKVQSDIELPETVVVFLASEPVANDRNTQSLKVDADSLSISITNSYTEKSELAIGSDYVYPFESVCEMYRPTAFTISGTAGDSQVVWYVDGHVQGYGTTMDVVFTETGWHTVVAFEQTSIGTFHILSQKIVAKYVRREIRSLTDMDREKYFNAAAIMSRVPTEVGKRIFGEKYKSKDHYNRVHLYYGGAQDCDHWHQGAGFVTSHVAFTLEFEQTLQSIYPDLSAPYWDFTLESTFYGPNDWRNSKVFSSSWFGDASPDNGLHTATAGRFGFYPTLSHAEGFSIVTNSYGLLRAPWNNDPTPFMTRSEQLYGYTNNLKPSGCQEYHTAIQKSTWMTLAQQLNAAAHGHIHETMGGSWNHHYADSNQFDASASIYTFAHEIQALSKQLWRTGYVVCPDHCDMDTPWEECQCLCDPDAIGDLKPYEVLDKSGVLGSVEYYDESGHLISSFYDDEGNIKYQLTNYTGLESEKIYSDLLTALCSPGHIGDMFQATSSNDITFWVLHGTLDRLWHFKRLGNSQGFSDEWEDTHPCYGHNSLDFQPFKNIFDTNDKFYTNIELYQLFEPANVDMPYMYDNFNWPHCDLTFFAMDNSNYGYLTHNHTL